MFLMCPLTPTSPSLCLLLIGHPWWLSHLVLKTVGCILSAQGPLGGYSSSSGLVLGGQGQSLCLSPCPSTLHTSLECSAASPLRKWGTLALLDWNVGFGPSGCLNSMRNECFQTRRAVGFARAAEEGWDWLKNTQVKIHHRQLKEAWLLVKVGAFEKAGRGLKPEINVKHLEQGLLPCFSMPALPAWRYNCRVVHLALFGCGPCPVASRDTVHLLCSTLPLLPAHVCLRFLDGSPGPTDHTCGERELQDCRKEARNCPSKWNGVKCGQNKRFWAQKCSKRNKFINHVI